ncbi:MAG TPA: N-acetylmuramoyl-L-alanine amidase, partial [Pyrinomonadaceae bacterium]
MRFLTPLALLLLLHPFAPAQVRREAPRPVKKAAKAAKAAPAAAEARTVVCIDPGHPSEVASGQNLQNGTSEAAVDWAVASKLREALEARGYEVVLTKSSEEEL